MTETRGGNAPLVGKLLVLSGLVMLGVGMSAWMRWLPYAEGTQDLFAKVFTAAGLLDLILGFVFMSRNR